MQMILNIVYLVCLLASTIAAFLNRKNLVSRQLFFFIPFLFLLFVQETSLFFYTRKYPTLSTGIVYNIYTPVSALLFSLFYSSIPFNAPVRTLIRTLTVIFLTATLI